MMTNHSMLTENSVIIIIIIIMPIEIGDIITLYT